MVTDTEGAKAKAAAQAAFERVEGDLVELSHRFYLVSVVPGSYVCWVKP